MFSAVETVLWHGCMFEGSDKVLKALLYHAEWRNSLHVTIDKRVKGIGNGRHKHTQIYTNGRQLGRVMLPVCHPRGRCHG